MHTRGLCGPCWQQLTFLSRSSCVTCGFPLSLTPASEEENLSCGACLAYPPLFKRGLSVLLYDEHSRKFLLRFKHGKELSLAPLFVTWLFARGATLWPETDLLIPVPLHWTRLVSRSFNQAALLTHLLGKKTGLLDQPFLLKRTRRTPPQGHKRASGRHENVKGAFTVTPRLLPFLQGARVTLVDDVYTTGATLKACTETLLRGGAASVSILTLARTGHHSH